jgi:hypothetical protein
MLTSSDEEGYLIPLSALIFTDVNLPFSTVMESEWILE